MAIQSTCPGCGMVLPMLENAAVHPYIGASPECWAVFNETLHQSHPGIASHNGGIFAVDAYAVQHPGVPEPRSISSVATHLLALYAGLEHGANSDQVMQVRQAAKLAKTDFTWLEPPTDLGAGLTVVGLKDVDSAQHYSDLVLQWAQEQWQVWSLHHPQVKQWAAMVKLRAEGWLPL